MNPLSLRYILVAFPREIRTQIEWFQHQLSMQSTHEIIKVMGKNDVLDFAIGKHSIYGEFSTKYSFFCNLFGNSETFRRWMHEIGFHSTYIENARGYHLFDIARVIWAKLEREDVTNRNFLAQLEDFRKVYNGIHRTLTWISER